MWGCNAAICGEGEDKGEQHKIVALCSPVTTYTHL